MADLQAVSKTWSFISINEYISNLDKAINLKCRTISDAYLKI